MSVDFGGRRFYPIGVAEKGYANYRITVRGTWGHGSMPRPDNAAVRAAAVVERLAVEGAARPTAVMTRFLDQVAAAVGEPAGRRIREVASGGREADGAGLDDLCEPMYARAIRGSYTGYGRKASETLIRTAGQLSGSQTVSCRMLFLREGTMLPAVPDSSTTFGLPVQLIITDSGNEDLSNAKGGK